MLPESPGSTAATAATALAGRDWVGLFDRDKGVVRRNCTAGAAVSTSVPGGSVSTTPAGAVGASANAARPVADSRARSRPRSAPSRSSALPEAVEVKPLW